MSAVKLTASPCGDSGSGTVASPWRSIKKGMEALRPGERVLVHMEELGDRLMGIMAAFLLWNGMLPSAPQAMARRARSMAMRAVRT